MQEVYFINILISIHAPAKGATSTSTPYLTVILISIHAPAKGATVTQSVDQVDKIIFQSTLPQRERRQADLIGRMVIQFQSTLPQRERQKNVQAA